MAGWHRWAHLIAVTGGLVVLYFIVPVTATVDGDLVLRGVSSVLVLLLLGLGVLRQLKKHLDQADRRIDGLIVTVVVVVVVFSFVFYTLARHVSGEFAEMSTRVDALYFTVATMATVGFGDVHATGQMARSLVLVLMTFNVVFVGTAVALMSSRIKDVASTRMEERRHQHETGERPSPETRA
jgi:voltage-gated potassium channel